MSRLLSLSILLFSIPCSAAELANQNYFGHEWALVWLTLGLFIATAILAWYTAGLYKATVKLSEDAQVGVKQQRLDTLRALAAAEQSGAAAERSAEISSRALSVAQRAFVFFKGFANSIDIQPAGLAGYFLYCDFENVGTTPATDVRIVVRVRVVRGQTHQVPYFETDMGDQPKGVMGPKNRATSMLRHVPVRDLIDCWNEKVEIYAWARIEYRDLFTPDVLHHHEQCVRFNFIHDPSTPPPPNHAPYVQYIVAGSQNTSN